MAAKKKVFGEHHPSTLNTVHNLGALLHKMGRLDEVCRHRRCLIALHFEPVGPPSRQTTVHACSGSRCVLWSGACSSVGRVDRAACSAGQEQCQQGDAQRVGGARKGWRLSKSRTHGTLLQTRPVAPIACLNAQAAVSRFARQLDKDRGLVREAEALLRECIDTRPSEEAADDLACAVTSTAAYALAELLQAAGRADEAKPFQELAAKHAPLEQDNVTEQFAAEWSIVQLANAKVWATRFRNRTISAQGHSSDGGAVDDGLTLDA
jgi:hypothetical protein